MYKRQVLDPFLGSGTTTKIAIKNERNSVGYELDENLLPTITKKTDSDNAGKATVKIINPRYTS